MSTNQAKTTVTLTNTDVQSKTPSVYCIVISVYNVILGYT